ncbi:beta-lactamase regulating signal transducer with metallopeptidase domain [Arcticibacter tournemirensis]|uniref:M48 family metalloprotease n=1 Tax=Arcticibacter tournemirensis TaxID=699437 RepID=A0A5M9HDF9_9SPHI|nr:M56 family metallopeptidase [Arcticibacter tournemirensis]KAA8483364.1 M48 family metalloprotease [Arcticibacter tournemirensis]TQM50946.1 beta-lactamase regulating signal transducer with metallopeptidase domain [Arcticibacter tournemirensis]
MDTVKLFHGLTEAMYESLGQGLIIYLLAKLIIFLLPWMDSAFRFRLLYISLCVIFLLFTGRMVEVALTGQQVAEYPGAVIGANEVSNGDFSIKAVAHKYASGIGLLYLAGILVQTAILIASLLKIRWYKNQKSLHINQLWQIRMESLQEVLHIKRKVTLYFGERIAGPFTTGWIKPVIFFPLASLNNLSVEQVEAILTHELAHIRRNDYLWNLLQRVMDMILFFNPVTWALSAEIRREREYCCDDMVLGRNSSSVSYAKALFLLEQERTGYSLIMQAGGTKRDSLLNRIKRLTDMETSKSTGIPKIIALTGLMVGVLFIGWTKPAEKVKELCEDIRTDTLCYTSLPGQLPAKTNALKLASTLATPALAISAVSLDTLPQAPPVHPDVSTPPPPPPVHPILSVPSAPPVSAVPVMPLSDSIKTNIFKYYNSPEFKKHIAEIRKHSEEIRKKFESPEWKQQIAKISAEAETAAKNYNSPEFKKQMDEIKKQGEVIRKQFESPEWKARVETMKKQAADMEKQFNSPEWKQKMQELVDHAKEMERKVEEEKNKQKGN